VRLISPQDERHEVCCILYLTRYEATGAAHLGRFANSSFGRATVLGTVGSWFDSDFAIIKSERLLQCYVKGA
jgi:hypothetical protein